MEVGRPMEDEQAAQEHPATHEPQGITPTGEPRVDAALAGLGRLALLPVGEHPAVFEQVHRGLREVLGELDGSGPAGRPGR